MGVELLKSVNLDNANDFEMKETLSSLHPNPGLSDLNRTTLMRNTFQNVSAVQTAGKHCILELYECNPIKLNDEVFIRTSLKLASKVAGANLLNMITHRFHPQGVTGLALLAESHISIHTWPESKYAAIDVFTCGKKIMPEKACELLSRDFEAQNHTVKSFVRDIPPTVDSTRRNP